MSLEDLRAQKLRPRLYSLSLRIAIDPIIKLKFLRL